MRVTARFVSIRARCRLDFPSVLQTRCVESTSELRTVVPVMLPWYSHYQISLYGVATSIVFYAVGGNTAVALP